MRLVLFDDYQVGVLRGEEVVDVSHLFEDRHIPFPRAFMLRAIGGFERLRPKLEAAAATALPRGAVRGQSRGA